MPARRLSSSFFRTLLVVAVTAGAWLRGAAPEDHTWVTRSASTDALGRTTTRYTHFYKGLRVWGSCGISHAPAPGGRLTGPAWEGDPRQPAWSLDLTPRLSLDQARAAFLQTAGPIAAQVLLASEQVVFPIYATFVPVYPVDRPLNATDGVSYVAGLVLAYDLHLQATDGMTEGEEVLLDATTGATLLELPDADTAATRAPAQGLTFYSGEKGIETSIPDGGGPYQLVDLTRGSVFDPGGAAIPGTGNTVLDLRAAGGFLPARIFTNATLLWGDGLREVLGAPRDSANAKTLAVDAAFGLQSAWDYFKYVHGRLGASKITGKAIPVFLNPLVQWDNSSWDNLNEYITIGSARTYLPKATPMILAHEFTHGVINATAGLEYKGESGGLSEATSDIFGHLADTYTTTGGGSAPVKRSFIGDKDTPWAMEVVRAADLATVEERSFYKPSLDTVSPDAWQENLARLDVHFSSGPMNRAFYFLAKGASALPGSNTYSPFLPKGMAGIGNDKAAAIWYDALVNHLTPTSNYVNARMAAIKAANYLFGPDLSEEELAVRKAFGAINVGAPYDLSPVPDAQDVTFVTALAKVEGTQLTFQAQTDFNAQARGILFEVDGAGVAAVSAASQQSGVLPPWTLDASQRFTNGRHTLVAVALTRKGGTVRSAPEPFDLDMPVSQLLGDPSLEAVVPSAQRWTFQGGAGLVRQSQYERAHLGEQSVRFLPNAPGALSQQVALPAGLAQARLTLWVKVLAPVPGRGANLVISVFNVPQDGTPPRVLADLGVLGNGEPYDWIRHTYDMTAFSGQAVELALRTTGGRDLTSRIWVDDLTLTAAATTPPVFVTPSPVSLTLGLGGISPDPLTATVAGSTQGVTWAIREPSGGTLDAGNRYQAPLQIGTYHAVATSVSDPRASGEVSIEVRPAMALRVPSAFVIAGTALPLPDYIALFMGTPRFSVREPGGGSFVLAGTPPVISYLAPARPGVYHVDAGNSLSPVVYTLTITVLPLPILELTPARLNVAVGGRIVTRGTIEGLADQTLRAAITTSPALGSVQVSGPTVYYDPPLSAPAGYYEDVRVSSAVLPQVSTTMRVTVVDGVAIQPLHTTILAGGVYPFTANLPFGDAGAVTWSVTGGAANGTIAASGLYTAPTLPGTYTVTAANPYWNAGSATLTVLSNDLFGTGAATELASLANAYAPGTRVADPVNDVTGDGVVDDEDVAVEVGLLAAQP